ncbi:unnamed protein product [Effrenium voratum]|nr:unnamed protein product [Effrenium voratum]
MAVLLIGTVPVDLEEESSHLVIDALRALRPEVVMLEGTPLAGVQAMVSSGRWEMRGMRKPNDTDWMHLNPDIQPVEVIREPPKKRHFPFFSGPAAVPERSLVPIKVSFWAYHLTSAVGGNIAAAVTTAASQGVPVRFLGPRDSGVLPGFLKVQQIAEQAAKELLEEERRKGQLSSRALGIRSIAPSHLSEAKYLEHALLKADSRLSEGMPLPIYLRLCTRKQRCVTSPLQREVPKPFEATSST